MKLRRLLISGFLSIALMSVALIGSLGFISAKDSLQKAVILNLQMVGRSRAKHLETFLEALEGRMIDFSTDGKIMDCLHDLKHGNTGGCTADTLTDHLVDNKLPVLEGAFEVFAMDINGQVTTSTIEENIGFNVLDDPNFVFEKEKSYIGDLYFSESLQQNILTISAPVIMEGELVGVIATNIKPESIYTILIDRVGSGESGEFYLVNEDLLMISPSRFQSDEDAILKQVVDTENSRACFQDPEKHALPSGEVAEHTEEIFIFPDYRGVSVAGAHEYISTMHWCLLAEIDEIEMFAPVSKLRNQILAIAGVIIILAIVFAFYLARSVSGPIMKLRNAAIKFGEGKLDTKIKIGSKNEIGDLAKSFNKMTTKLQGYHADLEDKVKKRTAELEKERDEAEKFSDFATDRELKMVELKKRIRELEKKYKPNK